MTIWKKSTAWKLNGNSNISKFRFGFDLRKLAPYFVPIGATSASRNRTIYQNSYNNIFFGELPSVKKTESGEMIYNMDLRYEPIDYIDISGNMGKMSTENEVDYWSRTFKITLPELPQFSNKYQEAKTKEDGEIIQWKNRELI